jgi:hypothetical protein
MHPTTINWADYKHAYGSATDAPVHLAALLNSDADHAEAIEYLFGTITHQETLYSATLPVLRYCIAQLPELANDARDDVISWIAWVGVLTNRKDSETIHETDRVLDTFLAYGPLASSSYAWVFHQWRNHATVLAAQVRAQLENCPTTPLTVAAYGAWGGDTTPHLASDDLTMKIAAAWHNHSPDATAILAEALINPDLEAALEEFNSEIYIYDLLDEFFHRNPTQAEVTAIATSYAKSEFLP